MSANITKILSVNATSKDAQDNRFLKNNANIKRLIAAIGENEMAVKEMMAAVGLKDRKNFLEYSYNPAIAEGFVRMLYPDSSRHPRQKYLLTVKGIERCNLIKE